MFGIKSLSILLAYILCILSSIACVVYGVLNWNKGADNEDAQIEEGLEWQKVEAQNDDNL